MTYYRPKWVCGRYSEAGKAAICYNLIEGMSYLLEDYSALVVSALLALPRDGHTSLQAIADATGIVEESIAPFFEELSRLGLVTDHAFSAEEIAAYRKQVAHHRCSQAQTTVKTTQEKLPMAVTTAEMDYMEKAGGVASVMFELTYRCSEQCIHCYNIGAARNESEENHRGVLNELALDDYKRIIDELIEQGLVKVCLSGGDPFAKPIAWDIIEYLYDRGIAFDVFTNGQAIAGDVERLANFFPRVVGVSIYSGDARVHDRITRRPGSWDRSMAVVSRLSELAVPLSLKCCIMQPNVATYSQVADLAKQYGAVVQCEVNVTDSIEGDKCVSTYLRLTPEMLDIVLRDDNTPMYVGKEAPNYGGQPRMMVVNPCGAGDNTFCITPDGDLIPCCAFHMAFGNLREQPLSDILRNSEALKYWRNLTLSKYEECGRYEYCDYCNLCPGINYAEHGTPLKPGENNCYMAKCRYQLANRMKNGYDPLQGKTLQECLSALNSTFDYTKLKRNMSNTTNPLFVLNENNVIAVYKKLANKGTISQEESAAVMQCFYELANESKFNDLVKLLNEGIVIDAVTKGVSQEKFEAFKKRFFELVNYKI